MLANQSQPPKRTPDPHSPGLISVTDTNDISPANASATDTTNNQGDLHARADADAVQAQACANVEDSIGVIAEKKCRVM